MNKLKITLSIFALMLSGAAFTMQSPVLAAKPEKFTIVDAVLANDGEFDVLQAAVIRAGLVDALNGKKQFTVFAPTDAAFVDTLNVANEAAAIEAVNAMDVDALKNILLFHVTNGRRVEKSIIGAPEYKMLNGDRLSREQLFNAGILKTNLKVDNGLIHIINSVLLP